tara:strand:+ start:172 stop:432 length:261 start_codon:yes stop_codon:yes gene_type:complete
VPKSLNISSNGDPGGNWKGKGFDLVVIVVVVEIFTTDGINLSAKSANEAGISFALDIVEKFRQKIRRTNDFKYFFMTLSTKLLKTL